MMVLTVFYGIVLVVMAVLRVTVMIEKSLCMVVIYFVGSRGGL